MSLEALRKPTNVHNVLAIRGKDVKKHKSECFSNQTRQCENKGRSRIRFIFCDGFLAVWLSNVSAKR